MLLTVSGTSQNRQGNATRAKFVKTAEKLFAEQGVDAVSVRSVNAAVDLGAAVDQDHGADHPGGAGVDHDSRERACLRATRRGMRAFSSRLRLLSVRILSG
ncbi:hypothetical protein [Mycolicibacterium sp. HS_4_1]